MSLIYFGTDIPCSISPDVFDLQQSKHLLVLHSNVSLRFFLRFRQKELSSAILLGLRVWIFVQGRFCRI